jgi:hypothetical protein
MKLGESGQALLEFSICLPALLAAVVASLLLFGTEWNRVQCAERAFLAAHRALRATDGGKKLDGILDRLRDVKVEMTDQGAVAHAVCGKAQETIALPDLEHAQW